MVAQLDFTWDPVKAASNLLKHGVSFPRRFNARPGETVIFAWIVFKSRAHRDRVNKKVMKDPRLTSMMDAKLMPFDVKRMVYGGFTTLVSIS